MFLGNVVFTQVTTQKWKQHGQKSRRCPYRKLGAREGEHWLRMVTWRSVRTLLKSESCVLKEAGEQRRYTWAFSAKAGGVTPCASFHDLSVIPKTKRVKYLPQELANIWVLEGLWSKAHEPALWHIPQGMLVLAGPGWCLEKYSLGEILPWIKIHAH